MSGHIRKPAPQTESRAAARRSGRLGEVDVPQSGQHGYVGMDQHGRVIIAALAARIDTKLSQGRKQISDRAFAHPRDAVKPVITLTQAD